MVVETVVDLGCLVREIGVWETLTGTVLGKWGPIVRNCGGFKSNTWLKIELAIEPKAQSRGCAMLHTDMDTCHGEFLVHAV